MPKGQRVATFVDATLIDPSDEERVPVISASISVSTETIKTKIGVDLEYTDLGPEQKINIHEMLGRCQNAFASDNLEL